MLMQIGSGHYLSPAIFYLNSKREWTNAILNPTWISDWTHKDFLRSGWLGHILLFSLSNGCICWSTVQVCVLATSNSAIHILHAQLQIYCCFDYPYINKKEKNSIINKKDTYTIKRAYLEILGYLIGKNKWIFNVTCCPQTIWMIFGIASSSL